MADNSKIEWTDATWNPVHGCTKISPGCKNCYAEKMARRLQAMGKSTYKNGFEVTCCPGQLDKPLKWRKPRKIFVCSMGDLFHKDVPFRFVSQVFEVMNQAQHHTFQILTKRPKRMVEFIERWERIEGCAFDMENVWFGVSIENPDYLWRADVLCSIPAAVRFVSVEPMLEEIDLHEHLPMTDRCAQLWRFAGDSCAQEQQGRTLDWVIAGCESGPNRRHISIDAFRHLRDQCVDAGVPFFLKQMEVNGKVIKMPELDGKVSDEMPNLNFPQPVSMQMSF